MPSKREDNAEGNLGRIYKTVLLLHSIQNQDTLELEIRPLFQTRHLLRGLLRLPEGINLLLDVPEEKIKTITESLTKNNILVNKKGRVIIDKDLCIDCGSCVSLCPTDALHFKNDLSVVFSEDKCIGCLLCIDSCPRFAIQKS